MATVHDLRNMDLLNLRALWDANDNIPVVVEPGSYVVLGAQHGIKFDGVVPGHFIGMDLPAQVAFPDWNELLSQHSSRVHQRVDVAGGPALGGDVEVAVEVAADPSPSPVAPNPRLALAEVIYASAVGKGSLDIKGSANAIRKKR